MAADITELMSKLEQLSPDDLGVLEYLKVDKLVFPEEIASELYVLPKDVYTSIKKLKDLSLVQEKETKPAKGKADYIGEYLITLTEMGRLAQALGSVKADTSFLQRFVRRSTPRYKK